MNKIILVDGLNKLFNADYSTGIYRNNKRVSGIINFIAAIRKIKEQNPNSKVIVCWDAGKGNREQIFPEYKAGRVFDEHKKDIIEQAKYLEVLLPSLGIYSLKVQPWEADDIIATLVSKYKVDNRVEVHSGDLDLCQLVDENVSIKKAQDKVVNLRNIKEMIGFTSVDELIYYKVIVGDTSDGIPGIKGIGEKTFAKLLLSVDNKVDDIIKLSSVSSHMDIIERNFKLVKLEPIKDFDFSSLEQTLELDLTKLKESFFEIGFTKALQGFSEFISPFKTKKVMK